MKSESAASSIVSISWFREGIGGAEPATVENLSYLANDDEAATLALVSLDWVDDGLDTSSIDRALAPALSVGA